MINFDASLYPPSKYKKQYNYLVKQIKAADKIKILLLTATPIFKSITYLASTASD